MDPAQELHQVPSPARAVTVCAHQHGGAPEANGHRADHLFGLADIVHDAIVHGDHDERDTLFLD